MLLKRIQPENMPNSPAFSQAIEASGITSILCVGGQNAVDSTGNIVGNDDFSLQCFTALTNCSTILKSAGYQPDQVIKWTIYMAEHQDPREGFKAFQSVFHALNTPPVITVLQVSGFARPGILVEVEATAVK